MIKKTLELKHTFDESEINEIAHILTDCIQQKSQVILNKAVANKAFNSEIKMWDSHIEKNSDLISDGYEYRDTSCEVKYNHPVPGTKTIQRLDTFDSWEEPMSVDEFDLFTSNNVPIDFEGPYEAIVTSNNQEEE